MMLFVYLEDTVRDGGDQAVSRQTQDSLNPKMRKQEASHISVLTEITTLHIL